MHCNIISLHYNIKSKDMDSFDEAKGLIAHSRDLYTTIEISYQKSIKEQEVDYSLKIGIKNFMENIRSALDYAARELYTRNGMSPNDKIYFPYAINNVSEIDFRSRLNRKIPEIFTNRPDIIDKICSYQHFACPQNYWMPLFMELNNENKHAKFSPQYKVEKKEIRHLC